MVSLPRIQSGFLRRSARIGVLRSLLGACAGALLAHGAAQAAAMPPTAAAPAAASSASASSGVKTAVASAQGGQRNKMKTCNAEARQKDLHKAERRTFMKQCLSKNGAT